MDILFLQNIWFEFLGTMSLLSMIRREGFSGGLAIGKDRDLLRAVREHRPRIVAFSCVTGIHGWALHLCRVIKKEIDPDIITLMGGPHPTFFPEILSRFSGFLDAICVGEGDEAIVDCVKCSSRQELAAVPNIHVRLDDTVISNPVRNLIPDLDSLPFMDRTAYYRYPILKNNPVKILMTGRGCPNACTFCFNHSSMQLYQGKGPYVRKRSVENVIEEIQSLIRNYPVRTIRFEDDLFGVKKEWLLDFFEKYPRVCNKPFICFMRADTIDREVASGLKQAGCYNVVIGVETGDEKLRNGLLKKKITDESLEKSAALFHEFGIRFCTTNILGLPGETFEQSLKTVSLNLRLKPTFVWVSIFQPYPRTWLGEYVVEQKYASTLDVDQIDPNYHSRSVLEQPDIRKSVNLHMLFYVVFNHPWMLALVRRLCGLPPNPLFKIIHRISFLLIYSKRWNISLFRAGQEAVRSSGFTRKVPLDEEC